MKRAIALMLMLTVILCLSAAVSLAAKPNGGRRAGVELGNGPSICAGLHRRQIHESPVGLL